MTTRPDIIHRPIGIIHTPHTDPVETPRQPIHAKGVPGTVELFPEYEEGLRDIETFSHAYLIFSMDRAGQPKLTSTPIRLFKPILVATLAS